MNCLHASTRIFALLLCSLVPACTVLGPDFTPPEAPALPASWSAADSQADSADIAAWWQQFDDPVLNELVARGASQNLSLQAAGLRIVQARAAVGISDTLHLPQQQQINANLTRLYQNEHSFHNGGISLDVGWELDIWGKYARGREQAAATLYASIASYRHVLVSLTAEIGRLYIAYRTAQERIHLSRQNVVIQQRVLAMTEVQFESGNVTELDVQQAKTQLFATQSGIAGLQIAQQQAINALAALLAEPATVLAGLLQHQGNSEVLPASPDELRATAANTVNADLSQHLDAVAIIPSAPKLGKSVAAQQVLRRPDLQVAELQARAQNARIGAASADLYPSFTMFGSIGVNDTVSSGDSLSLSNAVTAAIGPGLRWNVFQYDRIKNQIRIEDARLQESLINYNQLVLQAVQEVENAMVAYHATVERASYDYGAVAAAVRAFNISATQYNNGLVTYERLLSTVQQMTLREDIYAQTRGNIATQAINIFKALGGGWQPFVDQPQLPPATIEQMQQRTDWGNLLDASQGQDDD